MVSRPAAAVSGVLAAGSALAAGHLVAAPLQPSASPLLAVGNSVIDLAPQPVKEFAIRTFGTADKPVLLAGMGLVILVLAVLAGLLSRRDPTPGSVLIAVFGLLGCVAALSRPDSAITGLLAPIAAGLVGVLVFRWLLARGRPDQHTAPPLAESGGRTSVVRADRRRFLSSSAVVAVGAGLAAAGGTVLGRSADLSASRQRVADALATAPPAPPVPAGADFAPAGTPTFITPNAEFYRIDTALIVPRLRAEDWRLRVHGMVERELTLSFADLLSRPALTRTITLACVSNPVGGDLISTASFAGVPVRDLLAQAGVRPGAQQVISTSSDGFTAGTPVDVLLDPGRDALLAYAMNGEPLPAEHGFPVRMVTPGLYGYVSATKWLVDLEVTTFDRPAYWVRRGWSQQAPVKTQSRIDRPRARAALPAGTVTVAGIAWAQHTGVDQVEVRVDDGPWQPARLSTEVSADTWRMWRVDVELAAGEHTVTCRATDRSGRTQTEQPADPAPDGATGWHSVSFTTG
ncbi:DMSO/TMAO reductase YedYZ, molybdopterin-dependent catalytic subunit [Goodfellowiella coeruleoviolacea]|uniref:DMSO/TMAO reductase YedYZ, molybdopterin-dependent catalytic subunit n=2 Tax=Goodfellowiella coeruleoviolacea TaxID=334858 RepID=A0AAE3GFC5_9PSEU|nr:DMSO/TMAO reductase YedYZ, molybdopterin-dependent catalytic subunit [Goodfellowiella coeruleoviolacea]